MIAYAEIEKRVLLALGEIQGFDFLGVGSKEMKLLVTEELRKTIKEVLARQIRKEIGKVKRMEKIRQNGEEKDQYREKLLDALYRKFSNGDFLSRDLLNMDENSSVHVLLNAIINPGPSGLNTHKIGKSLSVFKERSINGYLLTFRTMRNYRYWRVERV